MKHVILCLDGAADFPHPALGGKTTLEAGRTPNLDRLAARGAIGRVQTSYPDLPCGSPVANLAILGYDPHRYHPNGRSSFEALAAGTRLRPGDISFRCNLVTISDDGRIADFTAGQIDTDLAAELVWDCEVADAKMELYVGQQYRHCLIVRDAHIPPEELVLAAPHCHQQELMEPLLPRGTTPRAAMLAHKLRHFMAESRAYIAGFNAKRATKATMFWLWSASSSPLMPSFESTFGKRAALVCGLDFLKGIAIAAGIETKNIIGTTGYIDTNLRAKMRFTVNYLRNYDFVYVHVNSLDEAAHNRDPQLKTQMLENVDAEIVGPLVQYLERNHRDDWRLMVLPDHYTLSVDGTHHPRPVPALLAGHGVEPTGDARYTEAAAAGRPVVIGQHLMEPFLSEPHIRWDGAFAAHANRGEQALDGELEVGFRATGNKMRG
ncbi:MAG: 2,3-bisphosphoglycerate-independent phosphoglycerate mutase [Deltaproteobacteria bacterium]|nr:2,3-bisphosphoglycerate-independent phosphoglycerate mutase [Deltaproteobacteria bacterium]